MLGCALQSLHVVKLSPKVCVTKPMWSTHMQVTGA